MINKYVIKNINKYNYMFHNLEFNKLEIIDDNDMKLFQRNTFLDINKNTKLEKSKNQLIGNMININNENDYKFIYIDKSDNIIVLDKEYLIKKYDCMDAKIIIEEYASYCNFLFLLKDKDDNYKVVIDDKIYELTDTFKQFLLLNEDLYLLGDKIKELKNNKWFNILGINSLNVNSFINTYKDYIKYKNRLEIFKKMGLTDDAINYLCQRKIHTIINTETEDGLIDIDNLNKFEIDGFNEIGEKYKKILKK